MLNGRLWNRLHSELSCRSIGSTAAELAFTGEDAVGMEAGGLRQDPTRGHRGLACQEPAEQPFSTSSTHSLPCSLSPQHQGPPSSSAGPTEWPSRQVSVLAAIGHFGWGDMDGPLESRLGPLEFEGFVFCYRLLGPWAACSGSLDHVTLDRPPCSTYLSHSNWGFHT